MADVARPGTFEARSRRSFGSDPGPVAAAVAAFVVRARTAAAWPRPSSTSPGWARPRPTPTTPTASSSVSADELHGVDLLPFRAGIAAGAGLVMVSSAAYPALGPGLALDLAAVLDGLLRGELGFEAWSSPTPSTPARWRRSVAPGEAAVAAAAAGVDLFIAQGPGVCVDIQRSLAAAITDGRLSLAQAQQAFERVATLRKALHRAPAGS